MTRKRPAVRIRNSVARSPLLRKGGAHQEARAAERQQDRRQVAAALDEWLEQAVEAAESNGNNEMSGSVGAASKAKKARKPPVSAATPYASAKLFSMSGNTRSLTNWCSSAIAG